MDLQVRYGTFLRKQELSNAKYEYMKPYFRKYAFCALGFAAGILTVMVAATMYAKMLKPVQTYDTAYYNKAQALSVEINKGLAKLREARPNGIDVCEAVQQFSFKPSEVELDSISIVPNKYIVKGISRNINSPNEYLSMLDFKDKVAAISDIHNVDNGTEFTITVTPNVKKGGKK